MPTAHALSYQTLALFLGLILSGCASTMSAAKIEQRTALAIGREVGSFSIGAKSEESGGRVNYTATTKDGQVYQCYVYGATGLAKATSFGMVPDSDAICTAMNRGAAKPAPATAQTPCNALLKAAGKCSAGQ